MERSSRVWTRRRRRPGSACSIHTRTFTIRRSTTIATPCSRALAPRASRRILCVGTDVADSARAQTTAARYDLDYAIGIHPHEAADAPPDVAAALDALIAAAEKPPRAIGEMGLDYYYDHSPREAQSDVLVAQLRYACDRGIPAIFHQRDAFADFTAILTEHGRDVRGVVHCFTGTAEEAKRLTSEYGLRLGIGGVATFKNAGGLRDAVRAVGIEHVILETDCPYLAPVPHRGTRNEPAFIEATAAVLATLFEITPAEVVSRTTGNGRLTLRRLDGQRLPRLPIPLERRLEGVDQARLAERETPIGHRSSFVGRVRRSDPPAFARDAELFARVRRANFDAGACEGARRTARSEADRRSEAMRALTSRRTRAPSLTRARSAADTADAPNDSDARSIRSPPRADHGRLAFEREALLGREVARGARAAGNRIVDGSHVYRLGGGYDRLRTRRPVTIVEKRRAVDDRSLEMNVIAVRHAEADSYPVRA